MIPTINIDRSDWQIILSYAISAHKQFNTEIGGMAVCLRDETGKWTITDPVILKQTVSSSKCDLDEEKLTEYYANAAYEYGDWIPNDLIFVWFHSHGSMGAFWSGTDDNTIEKSSKTGNSISLVVNIKGEYKLRLCTNNVFKMDIDNCNLNITDQLTNMEFIDKEVKKLCTKNTYNYNNYNYNYYNNKKSKQSKLLLPSNTKCDNKVFYNKDDDDDEYNPYDPLAEYEAWREYDIVNQQLKEQDLFDKESEQISAKLEASKLLERYSKNQLAFGALKKGFKSINKRYCKYSIAYRIPKKAKELTDKITEKDFRIEQYN